MQQIQEGYPDLSLLSTTLQLPLEDPKASPDQRGYVYSPVNSGSALGCPATRAVYIEGVATLP